MAPTKRAVKPLDNIALDNFAKQLLGAFQKGTDGHTIVDEKEVNEIFERFTHSDVDNENFALEALSAYCYVDPTKNYTRNLIIENEHFSLMVLCWNPGAKSCIHAHGGSQCWLRVMKGVVRESFWICDPNSQSKINHTTPSEVHIGRANDILYIDDNRGVHCIENLDNPTISLHCYAPPYQRCKCFDSKTGTEFIGSTSFDSEYGEIKNENLIHFNELYGEE
jgi:cysteine dioxygenase